MRDLETAEKLRPEGDEDEEELSFAHVTDTVQRNERRKQKEWTLQTDTPIAESGANGYTCVHVTGAGNPKGLKLSRNFALVQPTSKPLSRANIGPGHVIEKIGTVEVQQLRAEGRTNKHLTELLEAQTGPYTIVFSNPLPQRRWFKFKPGTKWVRLFTDGGRRKSHKNGQGPAAYGWAIVVGPFGNHNPHQISDAGGTCIATGGGYLGAEGHTNNTAEGLGIQAGLEACVRRGLYNVDHMSDSSLMCNVLNDKSKTTQYRLHEIA